MNIDLDASNVPCTDAALTLADGTYLVLSAGDETAARVLGFLARIAQLAPQPLPAAPAGDGQDAARLLVVTGTGTDAVSPCADTAGPTCVLIPPDAPARRLHRDRLRVRLAGGPPGQRPEPLPAEQWFWQQLARLSAAIGRETQARGGVLLHSGLAACPGPLGLQGVLLAGRSGVGKSTASRRLPAPWRSLSDDMTLLVRDCTGAYRAHPWPTWSRFFGEEAGDGSDTWDVQHAAPLRAIVVLEQGPEDRIEPLGPGHAVALLAELAQQAAAHLVRGIPRDELPAFHLQRFENLCALVRAVPAYLLYVRLGGAFWEQIEGVISPVSR